MRPQRFQSHCTRKTTEPPQLDAPCQPVFSRLDPAHTGCPSLASGRARTSSLGHDYANIQRESPTKNEWPSVQRPNNEYRPGAYPILHETPELMHKKQEGFLRAIRASSEVTTSAVAAKLFLATATSL